MQKNIKFWLFKGIYFTGREAQCMVLILQKNTCKQISEKLKLSTRTVETYVSTMKSKLHCETMKALIEKVERSRFSDYIAVIEQSLKNFNTAKEQG